MTTSGIIDFRWFRFICLFPLFKIQIKAYALGAKDRVYKNIKKFEVFMN